MEGERWRKRDGKRDGDGEREMEMEEKDGRRKRETEGETEDLLEDGISDEQTRQLFVDLAGGIVEDLSR